MKLFSSFVLSVFLFASLAGSALAAEAWPATSQVEIGASIRALYPAIEPSGLAWHSGRDQLLLVGDEGQLIAFNTDGSNPTLWNVGGDLEDVAVVDPSSSSVYLVDEDGKILKYDLSTSAVTQTWDLTGLLPEVSGRGMEGLTYAEGYFYVGYQYDGKIYVLDLSGTTATKVNEFAGLSGSGYTDLSGLHYRDGYLYVLYASTMAVMGLDGTVYTTYSVPGIDQEGLALGLDSNGDGDANMYIAEDATGNIYSYDNFPLYGWTAPVVDPDSDVDGVPASSDCNDADATVSTLQTFYVDADGDGLGSQTAGSVCSATAPSGYATNTNDTNDAIPNAGVEIKSDRIDNNSNSKTDETNVGFTHPYYSTLDPSISSTGNILNVTGLGYGDFYILYGDRSAFRFSVFNTSTRQKSTVSLVAGTSYLDVTSNGSTVRVNAYTGVVVP